jgi:hypothetical protein
VLAVVTAGSFGQNVTNVCFPPCFDQLRARPLQRDHRQDRQVYLEPGGKHCDTLAIHKLQMYEGAVVTAPFINTRMRILCMRIEMPSNLSVHNLRA